MKPGLMTTEFWVTIAAILTAITPLVPANAKGYVIAAVAVAYAISRAVVKATTGPSSDTTVVATGPVGPTTTVYGIAGAAASKIPLVLVLLSTLALAGTGCQHPTPQPGQPVISSPISCGTQAIEKCAPLVLPAVNECLAGLGDVVACGLGLIQPAGCATYEVLACLFRHEQAAAADAATANPADVRDKQRAARAAEFLSKTGAKFSD